MLPFNLLKKLGFFMYKHISFLDIYNEISLQLELGLFLRAALAGSSFKVQFERNINSFVPISRPSGGFVKKEIDIVIFDGKTPQKSKERYAIELKFPVNGQYPEQMFAFITDMQFMEEVKNHANFNETYCITLVEDSKFHTGASRQCDRTGIYQYFRGDKRKHCPVQIKGRVDKPTGGGGSFRLVNAGPVIKWRKPIYSNDRRFYILKF